MFAFKLRAIPLLQCYICLSIKITKGHRLRVHRVSAFEDACYGEINGDATSLPVHAKARPPSYRSPMTLWFQVSNKGTEKAKTHHFKRPHPPNPNLELTLHARHVLEIDAFPPAAPGRLAPKQQQLLGHADCVGGAGRVVLDVGAQSGEGDAADYGLVGLACAVAPCV